ncbi:MAG: hypothetical protein NVS2B3_04560 [Vulcanimicrobiaceae bacterium]
MYLTCELLQGGVVDGHPLHRYLATECAIPEAELREIARSVAARRHGLE